MFTGIIPIMAEVTRIRDRSGLRTVTLRFSWRQRLGLRRGASVAIDGVCMTVTKKRGRKVLFDAMDETLQKTTLGSLREGDRVHIERSFKTGDEVGGHILSGHVSGLGEIVAIEQPENNYVLTIKLPKALMKYVFEKGFIAIHGASLTIVDVDRKRHQFSVHLIPETLEITKFGDMQVGDQVNIEVDSRTQAIVETVERMQNENKAANT